VYVSGGAVLRGLRRRRVLSRLLGGRPRARAAAAARRARGRSARTGRGPWSASAGRAGALESGNVGGEARPPASNAGTPPSDSRKLPSLLAV
jgi:hypothetical protein